MSEPIKCPYCKKEYKNYKSFHRHKSTKHSDKIQSVQDRIDEYNANPKHCKQCNGVLVYENRHNTFCCHSCSAKYSNANRDQEQNNQKLLDTWRSKLGSLNRDKPHIQKVCNVTFSVCETCHTTYLVKRGCSNHFCAITCNPEYYTKKSYRTQCKFKVSPTNHPTLFDSTLIESVGWYVPTNHKNSTNLNGVCWDHLYRISEGYENKVDPKIMSHPANAELVPWPINKSRSQSMISYDQLMERIRQWNLGNHNLPKFYTFRGAGGESNPRLRGASAI